MAQGIDPDTAASTMRAARLEPLEPFHDADAPWRCRCLTCTRVVTPRLAGIGAGGGCKYCATRGLDLNAPAIISVLTHSGLNAHAVDFDAASGEEKDRLTSLGWEAYKSAGVPTVEDAYDIRGTVLRWLRLELALPPCPALPDAPDRITDGSVAADAIEPSEIWAKVSGELSRKRRRRRAAGGTHGRR